MTRDRTRAVMESAEKRIESCSPSSCLRLSFHYCAAEGTHCDKHCICACYMCHQHEAEHEGDKMKPLVCEYLLTHSFADLLRDHGVEVSVSATRPYKASFNYNQLLAKESDPLACQCRGLILATLDGDDLPTDGVVGETKVLARPMDRFFNHGSGHAPEINLTHPDTRVFEKLDGTLIICYFDSLYQDRGEWCVATRAVPDADRTLSGMALTDTTAGPLTFRKLFEIALAEHGLTFEGFTREWLSDDETYCYELTTPYNMIVVRHERPRLHFLASRTTADGHDWFNSAPEHPIPMAPSYQLHTTKELLAHVNSRSPRESEGVVVRMGAEGKLNRVKVKSAAYLAASRLKDSVGASPRSMLEVILLGKEDDVAPLLPKMLQDDMHSIKSKYALLAMQQDSGYYLLASTVGTSDRKNFAVAAQAMKLMIGPAMARFSGKCGGFHEWVMGQRKGEFGDSFLDGLLNQMRSA